MEKNAKFSPESGVSITELMVAMGISFLAVLTLADVNKLIFKEQTRVQSPLDLREKFDQLTSLISERDDVIELLKYSYHQELSSGATKCLFDPTVTAVCQERPDWSSATLLRAFFPVRDGDGNVIPPTSDASLGVLSYVEDPYTPVNEGFRKDGSACTDFDPVNGNDSCPYRFVLKWKPDCRGAATSCKRPNFAQLRVELEVKARSSDLMINTSKYSLNVDVPVASKKVVALGAGTEVTTCVIYEDTTARCWGANPEGNLGANVEGRSMDARPQYVKDFTGTKPLTGIKKIVDGQSTLCALVQKEGKSRVTCWGENQHGGVGLGTRGPQYGTGATGLEIYSYPRGWVVSADGSGALEDVEDIWGGDQGVCALVKSQNRTIGRIFCWGDLLLSGTACVPNRNAGADTSRYSFFTQSAQFPPWNLTGYYNSTFPYWSSPMNPGAGALPAPQTLYFQSVPTEIKTISAGDPENALINATSPTGHPWVFGEVDPTRGCNMVDRSQIKKFHHGRNTSCFITGSQKELNCWGTNTYSQLGARRDVVEYLRLNSTFRVPAVGQPGYSSLSQIWSDPPPFLPLRDVVEVNMDGAVTAYAVMKDGRVVSWGSDRNPSDMSGSGLMGRGALVTSPTSSPDYMDIPPGYVKKTVNGVLSDLTGVKRVIGGAVQSCAMTETGELWCWGSNWSGQLGANLPFETFSPAAVKVLLPEPIKDFKVGYWHGCGLATSGNVYCWGCSGWGEIGVDKNGVVPDGSILGYTRVPKLVGTLSEFEGP